MERITDQGPEVSDLSGTRSSLLTEPEPCISGVEKTYPRGEKALSLGPTQTAVFDFTVQKGSTFQIVLAFEICV